MWADVFDVCLWEQMLKISISVYLCDIDLCVCVRGTLLRTLSKSMRLMKIHVCSCVCVCVCVCVCERER